MSKPRRWTLKRFPSMPGSGPETVVRGAALADGELVEVVESLVSLSAGNEEALSPEREAEIRGLLGDGAARDCLNEIEREIARDAYALGLAAGLLRGGRG